MFKTMAILAILAVSYTQAFQCQFTCPENSKCVAEDKCECIYGYKQSIADFDGKPYCRWQGTTTTKRTPQTNDDEVIQDESQHQDVEVITSTENAKKLLPMIVAGTVQAVPEDHMVYSTTDITTTDDETSEFTTTKTTNAVLNSSIDYLPSAIVPTTTTQKTIEEFDFTTMTSFSPYPTQIVKIIKHVEQRIKNHSATEAFYISLGVMCTALAFIFATTVVFDCVKL